MLKLASNISFKFDSIFEKLEIKHKLNVPTT